MPAGKFTLGKWAWPVTVVAGAYLLAMLLNVVLPTGLASPRGYFNLDWITLVVMIVVAIAGLIFFLAARGGRAIGEHLRDDVEEALTGNAAPSRAAQDT